MANKSEVLERAMRLGLHGVTSNDKREYTCHECGSTWRARDRYLWWPIRLVWGDPFSSTWWTWHGVEVGADAIEQRVYKRVLHFGRLKIVFGRDSRRTSEVA